MIQYTHLQVKDTGSGSKDSAEQSFQVHMMNVAKQSGSVNCGL